MQLPDFKRNSTNILGSRLKESRPLTQVVLGPRQAGKTTAILQVYKEWVAGAHYRHYRIPLKWVEKLAMKEKILHLSQTLFQGKQIMARAFKRFSFTEYVS